VRDDKSDAVRVIGTDAGADLAILRVPDIAGDIASFPASGLEKPGEPVIVAGYPLQGLLTSKASVTTGIISALAGPNEDKKLIQITAPVQPGNSGGPLVDAHGTVIGVVVSKRNGLRVARTTGSIPENINFAVTADLARALLDKNSIKYDASPSNLVLATPEIPRRCLGSLRWCSVTNETSCRSPRLRLAGAKGDDCPDRGSRQGRPAWRSRPLSPTHNEIKHPGRRTLRRLAARANRGPACRHQTPRRVERGPAQLDPRHQMISRSSAFAGIAEHHGGLGSDFIAGQTESTNRAR